MLTERIVLFLMLAVLRRGTNARVLLIRRHHDWSRAGVAACEASCATHPRPEPVCGSDGVTYINMAHLDCISGCSGDEIRFVKYGACIEQTTTFPTIIVRKKRDYNDEVCISRCPSTSEYNPVCGDNRVTYYNPGKFTCAVRCGVEVSSFTPGRCREPPAAAQQNGIEQDLHERLIFTS